MVARNGMNALISKDLTALPVTLLSIAPPAREAMIATASYYRPEFREDLAEDVGAAPFAPDVIDALISETWSAEWSMQSALHRPESPVVFGPAPRASCVLLIDEDQGALGALRIYLLCAGYRVFAAASADEALNLVRMARMGPSLIDLVIADLDLNGDDDGIVAIDKTRRLAGYNVPAVLLVDQASVEIGKPALAADVSRLRKPVDVDELNALIREVLKRPKALSPSSTENRRCEATNPAQRPAASESLA